QTLVDDALMIGEENESRASEQVEMEIANILERINHFTRVVSELLESGKSMLKEVSDEFEERVFHIHKEQIEKWQEQIKELRLLDTENEAMDACLHNAKCLLQTVHA
ncbi:knotted 1-binding protein 36, partial [Genlisea aurea]